MSEDKTFQAVVTITTDHLGRIKSEHGLKSPEDRVVTGNLPSGGQAQLAHGLLMEAAKREVLLCILVQMQADPDWLERVRGMSGSDREAALNKLSEKTSESMVKTLRMILPQATGQMFDELPAS